MQGLLCTVNHDGDSQWALLRGAAALGDVHPAQRLRSKTATVQPLDGAPLGFRGGPNLAIHTRCSLAIVFRHSFHGQCLGRVRVDQEPLQGFHPAPVPITSCLGDTNLQSPHPTVYDGPIDLVPCAAAGRGRRIRVRGSHDLLASCRGDSAYALAIPRPLPVPTPCDALPWPAHPCRKATGLPSSTAMTRWGGCCLSTGGVVS